MIYLLVDTEERGPIVNLYGALGVLLVLVVLGYALSGMGYKVQYWFGIGVLILAWFIYLIVAGARNRSQVYLFWSFCVTLAAGMLVAMGIDFIVYQASSVSLPAEEEFKKHIFESTFLSSSIPVVIICWAAIFGLFWIVWSQGMRLKDLLGKFMPPLAQLDEVTYRMIAIGWPLLTAGIVTGAIWANSAWGTYWSWDPKETWSLITWFVYAIYLHARYVRGWKGAQMAVISAVGFLAVIFTYLGVNLVLSGLHAYGGL